MIQNKYNIQISEKDFAEYLTITKNSIYKILCLYEENEDWEKPLKTVLFEIAGGYELFNNRVNFLKVVNKLESLMKLDDLIHKEDPIEKEKEKRVFFRKTIFEILTLMDREIKNELSRLV